MAGLRVIRKRIRSVRSTQKITKAMKMIAAARLRRFQAGLAEAAPYAQMIEELLTDLAAAVPEGTHPLLGKRPVARRVLVVMTSDRGLCGAFNHNILRAAQEQARSEAGTSLLPIGKKAAAFFARRKHDLFRVGGGFWAAFSYERAAAFAEELSRAFLEGACDRVDLLYNEFRSVISQKPKVVSLLPVSPPAGRPEAAGAERLYEPDRAAIVRRLVPRAVGVRFYHACLHSLTSEAGARMTAMDSATRNSEEMIDSLTLAMNRARQAAITKELMEIIAGAEALK